MRYSKNITLPFFNRFGRTMTLVDQSGSTPFKAFLQPLRYKNKMYLSGTLTSATGTPMPVFSSVSPSV